jgi:hypothetical protein
MPYPGRCVVLSANLDHNHSLPQDVPSSLPFDTHRTIPPELEAIAVDMQGFRLPYEIHTMLIRMASRRNLPVTWTERDIRNRYPMGGTGNMWQMQGLLERLSLDGKSYRKSMHGEDESGENSGVVSTLTWLQHNGDMEVVLSAADTVIFDNTFNTNSLGYKLGVFSTVDRYGCTRLVACTFMLHETRSAFAIVLRDFAELLGRTPVVILTDGDLWLAEAIAAQWGSVHLLCTWHLSKNILRNVKPCFANHSGPLNQSSAWTQFLRKWWVTCWKSDTSSLDTFDAEWLELRQFFLDNASQPESAACQRALRFLGSPPQDDYVDGQHAQDDDVSPAYEGVSQACHATPRHATPRQAMPHSCHDKPCRATPRHTHATPRHTRATPRHATPRHTHATTSHATLHSCHATPRLTTQLGQMASTQRNPTTMMEMGSTPLLDHRTTFMTYDVSGQPDSPVEHSHMVAHLLREGKVSFQL